jgi:hypothetical protein
MARMFQILRDINGGHEEVHIFRKKDEAEAWLRLRESSK